MVEDGLSQARQAEFEQLYRTHQAAVRRHLVYLAGDNTVAEDLTQESFSRLYEHELAENSRELTNPRAWLLTVASNLAYNHFRAETRRTAREGAAGTVAPQPADVDDILDVRRALSDLGDRDRMVLMLRHSGFAYAEIAEAVGVAPGSVGTILARAQRRFREVYEGVSRPAGEKE